MNAARKVISLVTMNADGNYGEVDAVVSSRRAAHDGQPLDREGPSLGIHWAKRVCAGAGALAPKISDKQVQSWAPSYAFSLPPTRY